MGESKYRKPRIRQRNRFGKTSIYLFSFVILYFLASLVFRRGEKVDAGVPKEAVYAEDALQINEGARPSGAAEPVEEDAAVVATEDGPETGQVEEVVIGATIPEVEGLYKLAATDIEGRTSELSQYMGKVALVVNVASACGYTASNYQGLEALYRELKDSGVVVLAFPCNQFGQQEPADEPTIKRFAEDNYGVTFPLFSKIDVNGLGTSPVYSFLKGEPAFNRDIEWNFVKFLVDRQGKVVQRFDSNWNEAAIKAAIRTIL